MKFSGHCPACEARLELGAVQPALFGACPACGGRYMVSLSEDAPGAEDNVLVLLPAPQSRRAWLVERGLQRPLAYALFAGALLFAVTLAFGLASLLWPEAARRAGLVVFSLLAWPLLLLLVTLPLSALAVRWLVARSTQESPRSYWRSVLAVGAGAVTLGCAALLLPRAVGLVLGAGWSTLILCTLFAGTLAGVVTLSLAPRQPYHHALAAGLVLALGLALMMTPFGWKLALGALLYVLYVPLLLLGAWIGARFRPAPAGPGAA
ncbi:MAG: hypothetical protein ABL998_17465 [Planctomycetota bacterium]